MSFPTSTSTTSTTTTQPRRPLQQSPTLSPPTRPKLRLLIDYSKKKAPLEGINVADAASRGGRFRQVHSERHLLPRRAKSLDDDGWTGFSSTRQEQQRRRGGRRMNNPNHEADEEDPKTTTTSAIPIQRFASASRGESGTRRKVRRSQSARDFVDWTKLHDTLDWETQDNQSVFSALPPKQEDKATQPEALLLKSSSRNLSPSRTPPPILKQKSLNPLQQKQKLDKLKKQQSASALHSSCSEMLRTSFLSKPLGTSFSHLKLSSKAMTTAADEPDDTTTLASRGGSTTANTGGDCGGMDESMHLGDVFTARNNEDVASATDNDADDENETTEATDSDTIALVNRLTAELNSPMARPDRINGRMYQSMSALASPNLDYYLGRPSRGSKPHKKKTNKDETNHANADEDADNDMDASFTFRRSSSSRNRKHPFGSSLHDPLRKPRNPRGSNPYGAPGGGLHGMSLPSWDVEFDSSLSSISSNLTESEHGVPDRRNNNGQQQVIAEPRQQSAQASALALGGRTNLGISAVEDPSDDEEDDLLFRKAAPRKHAATTTKKKQSPSNHVNMTPMPQKSKPSKGPAKLGDFLTGNGVATKKSVPLGTTVQMLKRSNSLSSISTALTTHQTEEEKAMPARPSVKKCNSMTRLFPDRNKRKEEVEKDQVTMNFAFRVRRTIANSQKGTDAEGDPASGSKDLASATETSRQELIRSNSAFRNRMLEQQRKASNDRGPGDQGPGGRGFGGGGLDGIQRQLSVKMLEDEYDRFTEQYKMKKAESDGKKRAEERAVSPIPNRRRNAALLVRADSAPNVFQKDSLLKKANSSSKLAPSRKAALPSLTGWRSTRDVQADSTPDGRGRCQSSTRQGDSRSTSPSPTRDGGTNANTHRPASLMRSFDGDEKNKPPTRMRSFDGNASFVTGSRIRRIAREGKGGKTGGSKFSSPHAFHQSFNVLNFQDDDDDDVEEKEKTKGKNFQLRTGAFDW